MFSSICAISFQPFRQHGCCHHRTGFACGAGYCRLAPLSLSNTASIGPSDTMLPWRLSDGAYKLAALPPSRNRALGQFSASRHPLTGVRRKQSPPKRGIPTEGRHVWSTPIPAGAFIMPSTSKMSLHEVSHRWTADVWAIVNAVDAIRNKEDFSRAFYGSAHHLDILRWCYRVATAIHDHDRTANLRCKWAQVDAPKEWLGLFHGRAASDEQKTRTRQFRDRTEIMQVEHRAPGHNSFDTWIDCGDPGRVMASKASADNTNSAPRRRVPRKRPRYQTSTSAIHLLSLCDHEDPKGHGNWHLRPKTDAYSCPTGRAICRRTSRFSSTQSVAITP
jgi:hypothetical protein